MATQGEEKIVLDGSTLRLSGRLTVADADGFKSAILRWPIQTEQPILDLRKVIYCDCCILQLLTAAAKHITTKGSTLRIDGPAAPLAEVWRSGGFSNLVQGA